MQHPASLTEEELLAACQVTRTRRGGPGGQHRNKVESAIVLHHLESGVRAEASERRSQHENKSVAIQRLRTNLALAVRLEPTPESLPSALWQSRCRKGRIYINGGHDDFPILLAEVLDVITHFEFDLKPSANYFGCSSSQLVKFLKLQPHAFELINRKRIERGLATLR